MVKFWERELKLRIKQTQRHIKLAERHGIGNLTMKEKARLVKQQRQLELLK